MSDPIRRLDLAALAAAVAIAAAAWFALAEPLRSSWDKAEQRDDELGVLEVDAAEAEAEVAALAERLNAARALAERSSLRARPVGELNTRIAEILDSLTDAGLTPGGIDSGRPVQDGAAVRVDIDLTGVGGYPDLTAWLGTLYVEERDVTITRIALRRERVGTAFDIGLVWWASEGNTGPTADAAQTGGVR
ncbi:MAG: hypothetical protein AAF297_05070 [Planctomycetota bacterium]